MLRSLAAISLLPRAASSKTAAALAIILFPASLLAAPVMRVDAFATAVDSTTAISSVDVGEQFLLRVYVTDIRDPQLPFHGVFSAGSTVSFDPALSSLDINQTVEFGPTFLVGSGGPEYVVLAPDSATGYTARFSATPPGSAPQLLFSVLLTATGIGQQEFIPILFGDVDRWTQLYGDDLGLDAEDIQFVGSTLEIVPEPAGVLLLLVGILGLLGIRRSQWAMWISRNRSTSWTTGSGAGIALP